MSKISRENPYAEKYDLDSCNKEPIHIIQTVQSFAGVLSIDVDTWIISQVSSHIANFIKYEPEELLQHPIDNIFSSSVIDLLKTGCSIKDFSTINPINIQNEKTDNQEMALHCHLSENQLIVQIEKDSDSKVNLLLLSKVDTAIQSIQKASSLVKLSLLKLVTDEVKSLTGYDRVMMYKFDEDYNGQVIAESKEPHLDTFLHICYPHTDIPKQARDLYLSNRLRIITDVNDNPALIEPSQHPITKKSLNLGQCSARGVSPIHLEYLRNMGVRGSMSVAIIENDRLWGLIACHHYTDKKVLDYRTRNLIGFFGHVLSGHLSFTRNTLYREQYLKNNVILSKLVAQMNEKQDVIAGLMDAPLTLADFVPSIGAAIVFEDEIRITGKTPNIKGIKLLAKELTKKSEDSLFCTNSIGEVLPDSLIDTDNFAGLLAIRLSNNPPEYIIWFRQPQIKEVFWGGNPNKSIIEKEKGVRISPRKSFEKWKEVITNKSTNWLDSEKDAVLLLRNELKEIVFTRINELKELHSDLKASYEELETFSYTISHDLRSPLRIIEGYSQILIDDYQEKLDEYGIEILHSISENVYEMNQFMDDILELSRLAKNMLNKRDINMHTLFDTRITDLATYKNANPATVLEISDDLPNVYGDPTMVRQVFQNLIENAVKYSRTKPKPFIQVTGKQAGNYVVYTVQDNGIGFEEKDIEKIFEAFNRLATDEEFEGTGIGLSIVKRIVNRHLGKISVKSSPNIGSIFKVYFPRKR